MRQKIQFFVMIALACSNLLFGQTFNSPVEYLSSFNEEYALMSKDMWDYTKAFAHNKNARKIDNRRKELIQTTLNSKRKISRMPAYDGNTALRDSVVSYLNISYLILNEDYAKVVDLEELAEQSYDMMELYMLTLKATNSKRELAGEMVELEFEKFGKEFNITFSEAEESKLSKKLAKAGRVNDYYTPIYLTFFKSFKQEFYLIESLNSNDMASFEQSRNALSQYAEEGLESLRKTPGFGADMSLKRSCQQLLMFYQKEADEKAPLFADFYLKKENMEKLQKALESKPKSKLTNKEIDAFNESVATYNNSLQTFNRVNNEINNLRGKKINNWNKTVKVFFNLHVP